jgi:hypothetical protein
MRFGSHVQINMGTFWLAEREAPDAVTVCFRTDDHFLFLASQFHRLRIASIGSGLETKMPFLPV